MTDRKPFAPMFTRTHDEPQPGVLGGGELVAPSRRRGAPRGVPASGPLDRVQQLGGADALAEAGQVADVSPLDHGPR